MSFPPGTVSITCKSCYTAVWLHPSISNQLAAMESRGWRFYREDHRWVCADCLRRQREEEDDEY